MRAVCHRRSIHATVIDGSPGTLRLTRVLRRELGAFGAGIAAPTATQGVVPDTFRGWMKQARIDAGLTAGTTTTDAKGINDLEREVRAVLR